MIKYIPESLLDELEELKDLWKFDEAMRIINWVLIDDPHNEDALLQVADIQYRKWEIGKASKAIDFLNSEKKVWFHPETEKRIHPFFSEEHPTFFSSDK